MQRVATYKTKFSQWKDKGLPRKMRCPMKCSTFKSFCGKNGGPEADRLKPEQTALQAELEAFSNSQTGGCKDSAASASDDIKKSGWDLDFGSNRCKVCAGQFDPPPGKPEEGC